MRTDCLGLRRESRGLPVVRKQFAEAGDRVRGNAREHFSEPVKGLEAGPLARSDEPSQYRRCLATAVAAEEDPVAVAERVSRLARSVAPSSISSPPSSRKRVSAFH